MKKKIAVLLAILVIVLSFSACHSYGSIPNELKNENANSLGDYSPVVEETTTEVQEEVPTTAPTTEPSTENLLPFDVPDNYKIVHDYVFAVLNSNNEVVGYKIAIKKDGEWTWEDCEESGQLLTTTTEPTTQPPTTQKQSSGNSGNSSSGSSNNGNSGSSNSSGNSGSSSNNNSSGREGGVSISGRNSGGSGNSGGSSGGHNTETTTKYSAPFKWEHSSLNNIPSAIRGEFQKKSTPSNDVVRYSKKYQGETYVMIVAPSGKGVTINNITSSGQVKYSLKTSGSSIAVAKISKEMNTSFTRE